MTINAAFGSALAGRAWRSNHLFPVSYLVLTQSMTALLIVVGLVGQSELAADIALVHGASLATFYAFSGNARNLILTTEARVPLGGIIRARLALVAPLSVAALFFCVGVTQVGAVLALILIARRALEWLAELELSERELAGEVSSAQRCLRLQGALFVATIVALAAAPGHATLALVPWALSPALMITRRFVALGFQAGTLGVSARMFPHFGSTAVTGLSIYVFRAILVVVAGKALAGDLFVAFAIASFAGTTFANVLGPSMSLYEQRTGKAYFPRALAGVMLSCVCIGAVLLAVTWATPQLPELTGKSLFFWRSLGWSLLGSAVMLLAQRARLRLIGAGKDGEVFGAEVVMNVCLIAAIPLLNVLNAEAGLETLYLINAILLLVFYLAGERGLERVAPASAPRVAAILAFCVFVPLFFQLTGNVFNPQHPIWDSGGVLRTLPLPVSVLACLLGLVLLGRFSAATPSLWTILGLLATMLISTVALAAAAPLGGDRAKLLLILQYLLPAFGLVLGAISGFTTSPLRAALLAVVLIVPGQLAISWLAGSFVLSHKMYGFSVYQHQQYVPVILATAFLVALPPAWQATTKAGRAALGALAFLLGMYVAGAFSIVAMAAMAFGMTVFAALRWRAHAGVGAMVAAALTFAGVAGYNYLVSDTYGWWEKFGLLAKSKPTSLVAWHHDAVRPRYSEWHISSREVNGAWLMQFRPLQEPTVLEVTGELARGGIGLVSFEDRGAAGPRILADRPGPFRLQIPVLPDKGNVILYQLGPSLEARLRAEWQVASATSTREPAPARSPEVAEKPAAAAPQQAAAPPAPSGDIPPKLPNLVERLGDWKLFGKGVVESPQAFFFGHDKPIPREVRTSAHNFYIDLAYNFGIVALVPLFALMAYTGTLLWRHRRRVWRDDALFMHAAVVVFLLVLECNLKVTLRQPYPGIAIYFLWGYLLARLQTLTPSPPEHA